MAFDGIYRPLPERCEIEASELKDAGWDDAAQVLWEAESRIRDLEAESVKLLKRLEASMEYGALTELHDENARLRDELAIAQGANKALEEWIKGYRIQGRAAGEAPSEPSTSGALNMER